MNFNKDELDFHKRMNSWFLKNGVYKADGIIDYPRDHLITHAWRSGDCDDWSSMFMEASFQVGYESFLMTVDSYHTVCFFKYKDKLYHNSNWSGVRGGFSNHVELARSIITDFSNAIIRDRNLKEIMKVKNE